MAKPANSPTSAPNRATATSAAPADSGFEWVDDLPAASGRGGSAQPSADLALLSSMPAPDMSTGKPRYSRKWYPVDVPASITDTAERAKAAKEACRKVANRLSGIVRRISKKDASKAYNVRAVENNGQPGVAVYRVNPSNPVTPTESNPPAA